ncbi:MAG: PEP-CTERM sorting domain-containing protein [Gemmatimonadaceae bacterium]
MRTLKLSILSLGLVAGMASSASAQVGFDDLTGAPFAMVPNGYATLGWNNAYIIDGTAYFGSAAAAGGFNSALVSGSYVMGNYAARPLTLSRGTSFNLLSGTFAAAWKDDLNLNVKGFANGLETYNKDFKIDWNMGSFLNLDLYDVDAVTFTSSGGVDGQPFLGLTNDSFAMDDLSFENGSRIASQSIMVESVVPEPVTMSLVGFGLFAVGVASRRRRAAAN